MSELTTQDELLKLAAKCEAASGPDRQLDAEIACAVRHPHLRPARPDDFDGKYGYTPGSIKVDTGFLTAYSYTRSLDDAMTLVPGDADSGGERFNVGVWNSNGVHPSHVRATSWVAGAHRVYAATPALALCGAALRAQAKRNNSSAE